MTYISLVICSENVSAANQLTTNTNTSLKTTPLADEIQVRVEAGLPVDRPLLYHTPETPGVYRSGIMSLWSHPTGFSPHAIASQTRRSECNRIYVLRVS